MGALSLSVVLIDHDVRQSHCQQYGRVHALTSCAGGAVTPPEHPTLSTGLWASAKASQVVNREHSPGRLSVPPRGLLSKKTVNPECPEKSLLLPRRPDLAQIIRNPRLRTAVVVRPADDVGGDTDCAWPHRLLPVRCLTKPALRLRYLRR